jgi:hypothetical protein
VHATLRSTPATDPADISESLRHLVAVAAGWAQTLSHIAKAEGGPTDGWPFRLLGFAPPPDG